MKSKVTAPGFEEAQRQTDHAILEAEKFRAAVEAPTGRNLPMFNLQTVEDKLVRVSQANNLSPNIRQIAHQQVNQSLLDHERQLLILVNRPEIGLGGLSDDDFFHLTCHIDSGLQQKIEKGCYVDLDKLLPKDKGFDGTQQYSNETKLERVQSDGNTYLVPARKTSRINCFRRWEQAFRMYTTIYCSKNPSRSREIWQYISIINTAAMSFNWDNIYHYDVILRQLMEFNPARSWAVTYNQMWNLSMTNPIVGNQGRRQQNGYNYTGNAGMNGSGTGQFKKKRNDYCWSFNRGSKCKFDKKCKFIERCSYCDSPYHGLVNCEKLDKKDKDSAIAGMNKKAKTNSRQ